MFTKYLILSSTDLNQAINNWNEIPKGTEKPQALTGLTSKRMSTTYQMNK